MGFEAKRKTYKLLFEDSEEMEGLEVVIRSTSMGNILRMAALDEMNPLKLTKEDLAKLEEIFAIVSQSMVSWNLTLESVPVATTVEALLDQEPEFVMTIIKAWTRALTQAAGPLEQPSQDGVPSLVASIPMESLSPSLAS